MKTSFGILKPLLKHNKDIVAELAVFQKEGRSHTHKLWEICYVLEGKGIIMEDKKKHIVKEGDVISIPPNVGHWMIPNGKPNLKIMIVYSKNKA